jgi:putative transcriptional regulator
MIKSKLHILMHDHKIKSIAKLSELTGISRPTLYRIQNETGDRIEYGTLNTLCEFFKCDVGDIMGYIPDPEKEGEG